VLNNEEGKAAFRRETCNESSRLQDLGRMDWLKFFISFLWSGLWFRRQMVVLPGFGLPSKK